MQSFEREDNIIHKEMGSPRTGGEGTHSWRTSGTKGSGLGDTRMHIFGHWFYCCLSIFKLRLIFGQFPPVWGKACVLCAGKVKSSSHSGNKTRITASAFCDFNRDTSPPGRAVSFHQLPESSGGRPGCVLWQKGTEGECLMLSSVKFSFQGTESHEDFSSIRFCLSLHWCSKLIFTVCKGARTMISLLFCSAGCQLPVALTLKRNRFSF